MENIALHIMDIIQNAIEAKANHVETIIEKDNEGENIRISVIDNGKGISQEEINKILSPFYTSRSTRAVGLGLPLLKQQVEQTGGYLQIYSQVGAGTKISFCFNLGHIDCPPIGKIEDIFSTLVVVNSQVSFYLTVSWREFSFTFDSKKIWEIFEGIPITQHEMREYVY